MSAGIPCDDRVRVVDPYEVKTREIPRPQPRGIPRPWTSSGPGEYSLITKAGSVFVRLADGEVTIAGADSREILRSLAELLEWAAWDGRTRSSLYDESAR